MHAPRLPRTTLTPMAESLTLFDIVPGKVIGDRFEVKGPHRQGGFSTAFEVTDTKDGARCELQLFPSALFESPAQAEQFRARLEPWTSIHSPHVLDVREVLELDADNLGLVTAFPPGEPLRKRLGREKHLGKKDVVRIGVGLLSGLAELHGKGLVHGDVKPHTIHVSGNKGSASPILVDGGVTPGLWTAKNLGEKTALIGTPYYAPVEQFGGDAPDVRSDIYNVAAVLFECATGVLPWGGASLLAVFQLKLQDPPAMKERAPEVQVTAELEHAIRRGCLADRNKRYESAEQFRDALEAAAG